MEAPLVTLLPSSSVSRSDNGKSSRSESNDDDNEDVEEEAQMEEENSEEEFIDEEDSDEDASDEEAWETGRIPVGFQVNRVAPRRSGRNRRAPQRYKDEHYAELILEDIPSSDIDDILNDSSE